MATLRRAAARRETKSCILVVEIFVDGLLRN